MLKYSQIYNTKKNLRISNESSISANDPMLTEIGGGG